MHKQKLFKDKLEKTIGKKVECSKQLNSYLTIRLPAVAEYYVQVENETELVRAVAVAKSLALPFFILGGGSNVVIFKPLLTGLIIHNRYINWKLVSETEFMVKIWVSSGYPIARLAKEAINRGWEGLEYYLGLPGTAGGAIYMNSKWTKPYKTIGEIVDSARLIDQDGNLKQVKNNYFNFNYDFSILQKTKEVVVDAIFRLIKTRPQILKRRAGTAALYRQQTQPVGVATSGCFFRNLTESERVKYNLPTTSVGYLIDHAGLKGKSIGDFYVSPIHANFIINRGNGKVTDLKQLVKLIKTTIKKKYQVDLQEEVVIYK